MPSESPEGSPRREGSQETTESTKEKEWQSGGGLKWRNAKSGQGQCISRDKTVTETSGGSQTPSLMMTAVHMFSLILMRRQLKASLRRRMNPKLPPLNDPPG